MDDKEIIETLFARSERGIEELSRKYGRLCLKVAYNVLGNYEDAEECVSDAYNALWNCIPPQRPDLLLPFLLKIVRHVSLNRLRYNSRQKRNRALDDCLEEWDGLLAAGSVEEELCAK